MACKTLLSCGSSVGLDLKCYEIILHTGRYYDAIGIRKGLSFVHLVLSQLEDACTPLTTRTTKSNRLDDGFDF
jgi:hypothetical protein